MQLKYLFLPLLFAAFATDASAQQNKPLLGYPNPVPTAPSGSFSYPIPNTGSSGGPALEMTSKNTPPEVVTGTDVNWVATYVPIIPIQDANTVTQSAPPANVKQQRTYMDGNNVPFQSITRNVANVNGQAKHLVQIADNRVQVSDYNFLPFSSDGTALITDAFQQQRNYYNALYPGEGYTSFSQSFDFSDANQRSSVDYAPGKSQVGQARNTISKVITNAANEVRIWEVDPNSGLPVVTGYYAPKELMGTEIIAPSGSTGVNNYTSAQTRSYTDKDGKLILKMVADGNELSGQTHVVTYQYTYYVYDIKGNLIYTIPPKAVEFFDGNNATFQGAGDVLDNLCFKNVYDSKGRLVGVHKPGEQGMTWIVYDRKDRPVMRQTPSEAYNGEWEVTFYDPYGRVKATSILGNSKSQVQLQLYVDSYTGTATDNFCYYLVTDAGEAVMPAENAIAGNTMMSYAYYDNYDLADPGGADWSSNATQGFQSTELYNASGMETPSRSLRVQGMPTGSRVRMIQSGNLDPARVGEWRTVVNFYDDKGRVIYTVSKDLYQNQSIHEHYLSNQYDFAGRMVNSKHLMVNVNADGPTTHTEFNRNNFESATGNLVKTWHKVDDGAWTVLCSYVYDDLGRVKKKSLGDGGEVQEYTYNIRGQLAGINGLYAETGEKSGYSKTFGESLKYDFGFTQKRYDGKVAGMIWRGAGPNTKYAYGYDYTQNQSLKRADFSYYQESMNQSTAYDWNNDDMDYSVPHLAYDKGGNITNMDQRGMDINNPGVPQNIDILTYDYNNGRTNQLIAVADQGVEVDGGNDFRNTPPGSTGAGYEYDANGNLVSDANKGLTTSYTRFNKPLVVNFTTGNNKYIEYAYDATGSKVQEVVKDDDNGIDKTTEYIGNFVYENNKLQYILTADGRTVFDDQATIPVREEYFVKDHLGNVRSVINAYTYNVRTYLATYEIASANLESLVFEGLEEVRDYKPGGQQEDYMAAHLDGADPKSRVGSSLLMHVMAGDKVSMNVNNYYESYNHYDESTVDPDVVLESVVSTLTGGVGGVTGETHNTKLVDQLFNGESFSLFNDMVSAEHTDPFKPKAYLNYILFDESMQIVQSMTGAFQANGDGNWTQIGTETAMEVPKNGYLAIYLSNASFATSTGQGYQVFFDRMTVTVTKGNLLQETHYYPFGLPIKTLGGTTTPDEFKENRRKYQGNEFITDLGLNWMDFNNRQYDPQTGRFLQVDPLAAFGGQDMLSPYAAMGNMPEMMVDPLGLSPGLDRVETGVGDRSGGSYAGNLANLLGSGISGGGGGGGWGGGSDWSGMNARLSAFGYGGCANIGEWHAMQQQIRSFNETLENTGYKFNRNGYLERIGGVGGIHAYADNYFASGAASSGGDERGRRRWRDGNYDRKTNGSPFDERGRELLGRWLDGSGKALYTFNGRWGDYMKSNEMLESYIKSILSEDAKNRYSNGVFNYQGAAEIDNGYTTGYEMLHGTDATVGGFKMSGNVIIGAGGTVNYVLQVQWNDIIDPNKKYDDDITYSKMLRLLYTPKDYEVHINWIAIYTIQKP